ncbi:MAG: acyl carrier protein [Steroidobacteraceae bacterium]
MDINQIRTRLLALLRQIAPDIEPQSLEPQWAFRDQFDFDSMDALHFATAVSEAFGIEIPERDYPNLMSLEGAARFVQSRLGAGA